MTLLINADALSKFNDSGFNFVDNSDKPVDFDKLSDGTTYTLRNGATVVQDNMAKANVVNTINNEFGNKTNI